MVEVVWELRAQEVDSKLVVVVAVAGVLEGGLADLELKIRAWYDLTSFVRLLPWCFLYAEMETVEGSWRGCTSLRWFH